MFENAHNDNLEHLKSNFGNDIMSHWRTWHIIQINTCVHVLKSWHRVRDSKYTSIYTGKGILAIDKNYTCRAKATLEYTGEITAHHTQNWNSPSEQIRTCLLQPMTDAVSVR